jgi:hypothetical protein
MEQNTTIVIPEKITENNLNSFEEYLNNSIKDCKNDGETNISIDLKNINNIDFFGYQMLYFFFLHIKSKFKSNGFIIENKSDSLLEFEKKMGIKMTLRDILNG